MTRLRIPAALCVLLLTAAFGQPFWGEHAAPSGGGGGDPTIASDTLCAESDTSDASLTCAHDATGAEMLLAAACGLRENGSSTFAVSGTTAPTYNSVSMSTPKVYVQAASGNQGYPDCAIWMLASPSSGTNNFVVTWDNTVNAGWAYVASLTNVAGTQDGDTNTDDNGGGGSATTAITLTPSAAGNLLIHFGTTRGNDASPCSVDNMTEIKQGITGATATIDSAYCIATLTAPSTSAVTDTISFSVSDRTISLGQVIK